MSFRCRRRRRESGCGLTGRRGVVQDCTPEGRQLRPKGGTSGGHIATFGGRMVVTMQFVFPLILQSTRARSVFFFGSETVVKRRFSVGKRQDYKADRIAEPRDFPENLFLPSTLRVTVLTYQKREFLSFRLCTVPRCKHLPKFLCFLSRPSRSRDLL